MILIALTPKMSRELRNLTNSFIIRGKLSLKSLCRVMLTPETATSFVSLTSWTFATGYTVGAGLDIKVGTVGKTDLVLTPKATLRCLDTELGNQCYGGLGIGGKF